VDAVGRRRFVKMSLTFCNLLLGALRLFVPGVLHPVAPRGYEPGDKLKYSTCTTGMQRITTFRSMMDRLCDGGPIR
jgi:hypothetical protein